jgi:VWFA-related protein
MPKLQVLALLLAIPILIRAQSPAPSPETTSRSSLQGTQTEPVLKITTRLVLVDVVALDKKGQPVTGLKAEDFSLEEEGMAQQIRVFSFQQPSREADASPQPVRSSPDTFTNRPTFRPNRTLSVILLDSVNTDVQNQKSVRQEMLKFLEKLPAGQAVAVYALGTKLRLLQDFTTDPSLLKQAVAKSKGHSSPVLEGSNGGSAPPYLNAAQASALAEMGMDAMATQIQIFQQQNTNFQTDLRIRMTLAALKSLAQTLAGYPGRKNLIWVSPAFPAAIVAPLSTSNTGTFNLQSAQLPLAQDYSEDIERVSNALSNARVAVYPVDASTLLNNNGIYAGNLSNTDSNGNYLGRTATGQVGGNRIDRRQAMGKELDITPEDVMVRRTTMNAMAEQTGGKAFYNRNDLDKAIREGMDDGLTYYTLGYYPEDKNWNGKFRKIALTAKQTDVRLRYRSGYFALDPKGYQKLSPQEQAMDLGQALSLDYPVSTALTFQAATAPPSEASGNKVLIRFGIDAHPIAFELRDDGLQHASIDCAVQAFDMKGEPVRARASTFTIALKPEQFQLAMQQFLPCSQSLDLGPGDYVMRLGVRDNGTGLIGTANARLTVPPLSQATGTNPAERKP